MWKHFLWLLPLSLTEDSMAAHWLSQHWHHPMGCDPILPTLEVQTVTAQILVCRGPISR